MSILVTCGCGKQFKVKDELAGKRGKCAACGQVLSVPTLAPTLEQVKASPSPHRACPTCEKTLEPDSVICLNCGHDLRIGKKVPNAKPAVTFAPAAAFSLGLPNVKTHPSMALPKVARPQIVDSAREVQFAFRCWKFSIIALVLCAILTVAGIVLRIVAFELYKDASNNPTERFGSLVAVGGLGLSGIAVMCVAISFAVLLFKLWQQVQDGKARTTPGKALGYLFIPFFNLYWIFVVTKGLAEELNRCASQQNLHIKPASTGLMLAYCLLSFAAIVPLLGILAVVINLGIGIAAFGSATRVAVALAEERDGNTM